MAKAQAAKAAAPAQEPAVQAQAPQEVGAVAGEEAALFEGDGSEGFVVDLSGIDENSGGFTALPRAMYPSIVDDLTYGLSQRSGNPMWTWTFEIESGEHAGRKLFFHSPFTPNMLPRVKKILARVAPEVLAGPFDPKEVADSGIMVGKRAKLRVDIRKYEGQDRNNVRDVLPPDDDGAGGDFLQS